MSAAVKIHSRMLMGVQRKLNSSIPRALYVYRKNIAAMYDLEIDEGDAFAPEGRRKGTTRAAACFMKL